MSIPKRRRRITLRGSFEDKGKYIRCWNCGVTLNVDRDLGNPERSGNYETDAYVYAQTLNYGGKNPISTLDELGAIGVVLELDHNSDEITDYYTPRLPQVAQGCWFCGCTNL
jgi:hypothetical protein